MEFVELKELSLKISRCGCVISTITNRQIKATPDRFGYPRVYFYKKDGGRYGKYVHRLLAMAFIPNPNNKKCVNHKDGKKGNFALENLEWVTHKENSRHARDTGLWNKVDYGHELRNQILLNLLDRGVSKEVIEQSFRMKRPALDQAIRKAQVTNLSAGAKNEQNV